MKKNYEIRKLQFYILQKFAILTCAYHMNLALIQMTWISNGAIMLYFTLSGPSYALNLTNPLP